MSISATSVRFDDASMWVELSDGRTLGVPLAWFPRLLHATPDQREGVEISRIGLHWETLDEDISIARLLAGRGAGDNSSAYAVFTFHRSASLRGAEASSSKPKRRGNPKRRRKTGLPRRCAAATPPLRSSQ